MDFQFYKGRIKIKLQKVSFDSRRVDAMDPQTVSTALARKNRLLKMHKIFDPIRILNSDQSGGSIRWMTLG